MLIKRGSKKNVSQELYDVMICDYMKWTYGQYLEQPKFFIDLLVAKINIDNENNNKKNNGNKTSS